MPLSHQTVHHPHMYHNHSVPCRRIITKPTRRHSCTGAFGHFEEYLFSFVFIIFLKIVVIILDLRKVADKYKEFTQCLPYHLLHFLTPHTYNTHLSTHMYTYGYISVFFLNLLRVNCIHAAPSPATM